MSLNPGTYLGPYEIVAPLGAGGMGEVYRAKDTRLDREVAVKVLPERTASDPDALARFEREAKAVAALSHPNILALYDIGTDHGVTYAVTELLEGETLREHIERSPVPWRKAADVAARIADGLAAAHDKGIVHRDLKPDNIFLTGDGRVKILDFGLARTHRTDPGYDPAHSPTMTLATSPGTVMGTVSYMSPEQVRAAPTDARSDLFSFGCVLYEMVTGRKAFSRDTAAETMTAILKEHPPAPTDSGVVCRSELDRVIMRCLEKNPGERFHSARDLAFTLRAMLSDTGGPDRVAGGAAARRIVWPAALAVAAILAVVGIRHLLGPPGAEVMRRAAFDSLAVLPFVSAGGDSDMAYLADEIPASIINSLSRLESLRVVPRESVYHYMKRGGDRYDLARELNVAVVLTGRISVRGDDLSVSAELVDVANDRQLWGERYSEKLADVLTIETEISRQISAELRLRLTGEEKARLAKGPTENAEAHLAYLQGRHFWNKETAEGFKKSIEYFRKAIDLDPGYALPYTGIADAYAELAWWSVIPAYQAREQATEAAAQALEIDDTLAEAHVSAAVVNMCFEWDWEEAGARLARALELNPRYGFAHHMHGHLLALLGHDDDALAAFDEALKIDPLSPHHMTCLADVYLHVGRYDEGERWARKGLEIDPDAGGGHLYVGWAYVGKGMLEEAIEEFQKDHAYCEPSLAHALALAGRRADAERILNQWLETSKTSFVASVEIAVIYAGLGETDQALDWLERAYEKRDSGFLSFMEVEPPFVSLHGHPRFDDLLRRMGLPPSKPAAGSTRKPPPAMTRLAVLPFENVSSDPDTAYLADEIPASIINTLSRVSSLRVVPRHSVFHYMEGGGDLATLARELNVSTVLIGRVGVRGEDLSVHAELVNVAEDRQVWGDKYKRKLAGILSLEEEIAREISEELRLRLTGEEKARLAKRYTEDPEAHLAYLQGRFFMNKENPEAFKKAINYFQHAIDLDSNYALAYSGMADAYSELTVWGGLPPSEGAPKAIAAALRALEIDDALAEAHTSRAFATFPLEWDWAGAEKHFKRAIELNPTYELAYHHYGHVLSFLGRNKEAVAQYEQALKIDPLSPHHMACLALLDLHLGRFDEAEQLCLNVLEIDPDSLLATVLLGRAYLMKGMPERVIEHCSGEPLTTSPMLLRAYTQVGREAEARSLLDRHLASSQGKHNASAYVAQMYAALGDTEHALDWLERAYEKQDSGNLAFMGVDSALGSLHGHPRFEALLRKIGLSPTRSAPPLPVVSRKRKLKLAVLPFEDLASASEAAYLADEIPASIIGSLSNLSNLDVVPRSTAFRYRVEDQDTATIGRDLGATAVLTGQINTRGDTLVIRAELVDVAANKQLWDERYSRRVADIFVVEEDIAKDISGALRLQLTGEEQARLTTRYTDNAEAYQHYLEGRFWWNKRTEEGSYKAIEAFDKAIALDPNYALAYAGKAETYGTLLAYRPPADEVIPKARAAAEKALSLDSELAEAHTALGWIAYIHDWDWDAADAAFQRALELNPRYARAHHAYAHFLAVHDYQRAIEHAEKAQMLDPGSLIINTCLGHFYAWAGRRDAALQQLHKTIDMDPTFGVAHVYLAEVLLGKQKYDEAIDEFGKAHELAGYIAYAAGGLGYAYAMADRREEAMRELDELGALAQRGHYVPPTAYARIHIGLGNTTEAFEWLHKGCDARDAWVTYIRHQPYFKQSHGDPRFDALLRRIGLPPSSPVSGSTATQPSGRRAETHRGPD